jgi:hypothetical protein
MRLLRDWPRPSVEDPDAYLMVDHRDEEAVLLEALSGFLADEDAFTVLEGDEKLRIVHRGVTHDIPLTMTPHDRYVALSSAAAILGDAYRFYLDREYIGSDTHAILIVSARWLAEAPPVPDYLMPLERGVDYFASAPESAPFRIPYFGHAEPSFAANAARMANDRRLGGQGLEVLLSTMLSGKADEAKLVELARSLAADPARSEGKTEAEILAELRAGVGQLVADPAFAASSAAARSSLNELRALTGQPPLGAPAKPWWKFW